MEVFISWSGVKSKAVAAILKDWLPAVIQAVKPYFTPEDLKKGTKWSTEISKKLDTCKIGIICLTSDNYNAPWILFEAGALSKHVDVSRVCPILFNLDAADISGPLVTFQFTLFVKEDIKRLVKMINAELENNAMADNVLDNVFEVWWPKLEAEVKAELSKKEKDTSNAVTRPDRELLEELLFLTRENLRRTPVQMASTVSVGLNDLVGYFRTLVQDIISVGQVEILKRPLQLMYRTLYFMVKKDTTSQDLGYKLQSIGLYIDMTPPKRGPRKRIDTEEIPNWLISEETTEEANKILEQEQEDDE